MIGYYVHHQGRGHLQRAQCIAAHAGEAVTVLSSLERPPSWPGHWVDLPHDAAGTAREPTARGRLHWAPLHHPGLRGRMARIAGWIDRASPALFVSDVSVEAAVLARLMGVPLAVAAMRGNRGDPAHELAYDMADALLAPWPAQVPEPGWPPHWTSKTVHTGAFSRYDGRRRQPRPADGRDVLVMLGGGGDEVSAQDLAAAQAATPGWRWTVLGGTSGTWTDDPWEMLCRARVVVTHAGQNALAECAAARVPTVVVPQRRPHGEQQATAHALDGADLATVRHRWPAPPEWPALLEQTARRDGERWAQWSAGDGAARAARALERLASRHSEQTP
ncbi:glycosyltransferase [Streptomyces zhihengii]|uniref:Glycosyl transferase family 28 C-terminal domain-containing protein n=1 Tax=Streptomyces zhihengii TaxID=1818004 RepID=A0ABS2V4G4_9ACTN|nr:glycosyltransferase [Streptomyces zhihengii]MBM9623910.1 hypothetical protein [Streptomyces zhihengii]